jgi:undecaprenyl diphosphate synthase
MNSIKNVAIIMDGNGRWAKQRLRPRVWGHVRGSQKVREIVTSASELGLESLTLYAFSTENWSRPTDEVTSLFKLLKKLLLNEKKTILKQNIQFNVIGNYKVLDTEVVLLIEELRELSRHNTGLKFSLAINYGGRSEIVDSVNKFLKKSNTREITEEDISNNLYNPNLGEIDLLIRTSGDQRVSNFLLWQICYSEFFFTKTKWPDFSKKEFEEIISSVSERERRFGGTSGDATLTSNKIQANSNLKIMS